jgi:CelD/BcsL family acetyltransferase involved in cellulose biosynthesis
LDREAGPVRFEFHNADPALLPTLREWKSNQYRCTGLTDSFSFEWTGALLDHILANPSDSFSAVVSVVWAHQRPVAISHALRAGGILHGCFTGFDDDFSKYSPGSMMLLEIAQAAPENGIRHFELGNGVEYYKHSLASGETMMAQGSVDCAQAVRLMRRGWHSASRWARSNHLSPLTAAPLKVIRPLREWLSFR